MTNRVSQSALFDAVRTSILIQRNTPPIHCADRSQLLPASFAQQRLWFAEQLNKASEQHNLCVAFHITGKLNIGVLTDALTAMVQRHEPLRTTFIWQDHQLWQIPQNAQPFFLKQDKLTNRTEVEHIAKTEAGLAFDIAKSPLLRGRLLLLDNKQQVLLLTFHHLAFDGWSLEIFMSELGVLYGAFSSGQASPLTELSVQYADFAVWQRAWLQGQVLENLQTYWLNQMSNPSAPLQISSIPKNTSLHGCGDCLPFTFDAELSAACKQTARHEGLTVFMFLLTAFKVLLFRLSGEKDIIVGVPIANRNRKELEGLIGLLVNTLPLRSHIQENMSVRSLMTQVRQTVLEAYKHQDFLFEQLIEALHLPRQIDRPPLLQVMFSYLNVPETEWMLSGLEVQSWNVHNGCADFDLKLTVWEKNGCFGGEMEFDCELFDKPAIESLIEQWHMLLAGMIANADNHIDALPLLTPQQTQKILRLATGAKSCYPRDMTVHQVFEAVVNRQTDKVALSYGAVTLSYKALNSRANQFAYFMAEQGITLGDLVMVCLTASPDFIIATLAILKLGATFLPIDVSEPAARIETALRGASIAAIIGNQTLSNEILSLSSKTFLFDKLADALNQYSVENPSMQVSATNLAYVMFTSGSTGEPKAVCIAHRGITRLVCTANYAKLDAKEVMLQFNDGAWEHRAIWGEDLIPYGTPISPSRVLAGPLPEAGKWVRLEISASQVGIAPGSKPGPGSRTMIRMPRCSSQATRHSMILLGSSLAP